MASGWAGLGIAGVMLIAGIALRVNPKSVVGLGGFLGTMLLLASLVVGCATVVGLIKRRMAGIGTRARRDPAPPRRRTEAPSVRRMPTTPPISRPLPREPARADFESLLTRGEMAFYDPLRDIVAGRFEVHVKPSLADVLGCRDHPDFRAIAAMHVDFLLCDRATLRPRLAIELDDASHRHRERDAADRRKAELLQHAGIPLMRQRCYPAYDVVALRQRIDEAMR
jgi:hypothetical protein